ncbi:transglutaminase family protein [uncultured Sphingomonas sp.]|uniref:transglutaminase family protein n=1 Tax=uncultured Sphingomonas sp. TaxID=158754 RepID=UPI0035CC20D0
MVAEQFRFAGDCESYVDPDNADLIRVIDRRRGMPVSLSIVYVAAARRVGWTAEILNVPGHVLVLVGDAATPVIIDPFRDGVLVDAQGLAAWSHPPRAGRHRQSSMSPPCRTGPLSSGCCSTRRPAPRQDKADALSLFMPG